MKGQVTIINFFGILLTFILYFAFALPVLQPMVDDAAADQQENPNEFTAINVALIYLVPFFLLMMIVLSGLHYAIPRVEGPGG